MKPDASRYNPDPAYLRALLDAITDPSLISDSRRNSGKADQLKVAARIGVKPRTFTQYLEDGHKSQCPYPVQFALECLAGGRDLGINQFSGATLAAWRANFNQLQTCSQGTPSPSLSNWLWPHWAK